MHMFNKKIVIIFIHASIVNIIVILHVIIQQHNSSSLFWTTHTLTHVQYYATSRPHTQRSTPTRLRRATLEHVSTPIPNHTSHNTETIMLRARQYKGELASPSRYTTLFITLLRLFSQFHYWLDRRSANVPAGTFGSNPEDALSLHQKPLPIIGAFSTTVATQPFSKIRGSFAKLPLSNDLPP